MIIEFYGTPGAGKTFLAEKIVVQMRSEGIRAKNIVELGRTKIKNKAINKVVRVLLKVFPKYKRLKTELSQVVADFASIPAKYNDESIGGFLDNIVYYSFWYDRLRGKRGVYLFDEGIAHQYVNMIANYEITTCEVSKLMGFVSAMPPVVYVTCEKTVNLDSIQARNRHVCYIDELKGNELKACINDYCSACENIREMVSPITVRREDSIQNNIQLIRKNVGV